MLLITQFLLQFLSTMEMFQKIPETHVCVVTRTPTLSQERRVINLMTSKKKCHTGQSSMLLGPTIFFTSVSSAKGTHTQSRSEYSKHSEFLSRLFALLPQELPIFNQSINISRESIPDGLVTTLSTSVTSLWQYLEIHTIHHCCHCE